MSDFEFPVGGGFRHGADDEAALLLRRQQLLQLLAQVRALFLVLDALGDADVRFLRQVDQEAPGDRDLRGQPRALGADRVLHHLHHQVLPLGEQPLDRASRLSPLWRLPQMSATCRNAARSPPMSMNADCMPGSTRHDAPHVDVADQAARGGALDVHFLRDALLDHRHPRLLRRDVDQDFLGNGHGEGLTTGGC